MHVWFTQRLLFFAAIPFLTPNCAFAEELVFAQFSSLEVNLDESEPLVDKDQTSEGREKLRELQRLAEELYEKHKELQKERKPIALKRDRLQAEINQYLANQKTGNEGIKNWSGMIAGINKRKSMIPKNMHQALNQRIQVLNAQIAQAKSIISSSAEEISKRQPDLVSLNLALQPIEQRMLQLWNEIEECRNQWCKIRQPNLKFARGDYEQLRRVLDDWLVIDGLWPSAYVWAALCAYEMNDREDALNYLNKAEQIRTEVIRFPYPWPAVSAALALVYRDLPGNAGRKYRTYLSQATKRIGRLEKSRTNTEWDAYFVLGRFYSEKDSDHGRAKACYQKALAHNPFCCCSQIGLAKLQIKTTNSLVRDNEGLKRLEKLWARTNEPSWRLAGSLALGYALKGNNDKAKEMWQHIKESNATNDEKQAMQKWLSATRSKVIASIKR